MALLKPITLDNGIVVTYHRITSLNKITNVSNTIEVNSYISEPTRENEKEWYEKKETSRELQERRSEAIKNRDEELMQQIEEAEQEASKPMNVFIVTDYISTEYDADMTIEDAYAYLKTTDKYKDAEDV